LPGGLPACSTVRGSGLRLAPKTLLFPEARIGWCASLSTTTDDHRYGVQRATVDLCHKIGAQVIVQHHASPTSSRFRMALANHRLDPTIETVSRSQTSTVSQVHAEIAACGDVSSRFQPTPPKPLKERFRELGDGADRAFDLL
jgi:hypothetical protein